MFKSDLNDRTYKILCYVHDFRRDHSYAPNFRQIGEACGVESTSLVTYYLDRLAEQGYITRDPRIARSVVLTAKGRAVVNPVVARVE